MPEDANEGATEVAIEFNEDHLIDGNGTRWALSCAWPSPATDIPAFLCIDAERRKRAWDHVKLTNQWTGETEETWKQRQNELKEARLEADRQIEQRKREKEHPGQYWDPCEKQWVYREVPGASPPPAAITAAVKKRGGSRPSPQRSPLAGAWACPAFGTSCCMGACNGGASCMMQGGAGEEVA